MVAVVFIIHPAKQHKHLLFCPTMLHAGALFSTRDSVMHIVTLIACASAYQVLLITSSLFVAHVALVL